MRKRLDQQVENVSDVIINCVLSDYFGQFNTEIYHDHDSILNSLI